MLGRIIVSAKAASAPAFDPATLSLSGWWRAYAGAPWTSTASAGSSAGRQLTTTGADPTVGTLNGLGTATCNGTTQYLGSSIDPTNLFTVSAGTIVSLFNASAAHTDSGTWYNEPSLLCTNSTQEIGLQFSSAGLIGGDYDGTFFNRLAVPCGTGAFHMGTLTWNGSVMRSRVDSGSFSTQSTANVSFTVDTMQCARSSFGGNFFGGQIAEIMTAATVLSDTDLDNIKSYFNTRYALAL